MYDSILYFVYYPVPYDEPPYNQRDNLNLYGQYFWDGLERISCNTCTWSDICVDEVCSEEPIEEHNNTLRQFPGYQLSGASLEEIGIKVGFLLQKSQLL